MKDGSTRYDWTLIKCDYICNPDMSLRGLSKKYDIRFRTIADRSRSENWVHDKQVFQEQVYSKATTKLSTERADLVHELLELAVEILHILSNAVKDEKQFNRYIVTERLPNPKGPGTITVTHEKIFNKLDLNAMLKATQTLQILLDIFGYINPAEQSKLDLEREKLEFAKEQLAYKRDHADKIDCNVGIVLMPAPVS